MPILLQGLEDSHDNALYFSFLKAWFSVSRTSIKFLTQVISICEVKITFLLGMALLTYFRLPIIMMITYSLTHRK